MPQQRAEGKRSMASQQRDVICSGNEKPHKCPRNLSHKTGDTNALENLETQSHLSPGRQYDSFNHGIFML